MSRIKQLKQIAKTHAESIHYCIAWNEALNGDEIEILTTTFNKELRELNGDN